MRSFIAALIILTVIFTLTVCNSICVGKRIDELLTVCEALKYSNSANLTNELAQKWRNCKNILALTTHKGEIERAENIILSLPYYTDAPSDFSSQLAVLISALKNIQATQRFSFDNIF